WSPTTASLRRARKRPSVTSTSTRISSRAVPVTSRWPTWFERRADSTALTSAPVQVSVTVYSCRAMAVRSWKKVPARSTTAAVDARPITHRRARGEGATGRRSARGRWWSAMSALQPAEDREDAAVVGVGGREVELGEDVPDVLLHGAVADHQLAGDGGVGPPLGHQLEHLALAGGELFERVAAA